MAYLQPSEYVTFGLSAETADAWIQAASSMVDAHCRRSSLDNTSYKERLRLNKQGAAQLSYGPVQQITAVQARFAMRREAAEGTLMECALLFGLPGQWTTLDPASVQLDAACGEIRLATGVWGLPFSELEVTYVAGFPTVPATVKQACAQIVKNAQATPGLNVRSNRLDTLQTEYFSDSLLDSQVRALLRPFVAERLG